MENFINDLFYIRDWAHFLHLNTKKHALHKILNEFYNDILDFLDEFCEVFISVSNINLREIKIIIDENKNDINLFKNFILNLIPKYENIFKNTEFEHLFDEFKVLIYHYNYKLNLK